jgi:peptidoglycan hydrolase-like protein with peptidoglycan-binding domain
MAQLVRAGVQHGRARMRHGRSATAVRPTAGPAAPMHALATLQRAVGNHAVHALLTSAPAQLQRLTEEEKAENLTSPRFAGEPRLERAFDNSPPIGIGERGDPVARVQEALVAAGFAMPLSTKPTGEMDGIFGPETLRVVRAFQAENGLLVDGRVGRQTLGALDRQGRLAPPPAIEPPAAPLEEGESGDEACSLLQEIETNVETRPASDSNVLSFGPTKTAPSPAPVTRSRDPIGDAVRRFKTAVEVSNLSAGENISRTGQFFWGQRVRLATNSRIDALVAMDIRTLAFVQDARQVSDLIRLRDKTVPQRLDTLEKTAKSLTVSPAAKKVMLEIMARPRKSAPSLEVSLWNELNASRTNTAPAIPLEHQTLRTAHMLSLWDAQSCGFHASKIAERLEKRGATPAKNRIDFSINLVPSAPFADQDRQFRLGRMLGEVLRQRGVADCVAKMKVAIDAGQVLHARVMSGIGYGKETTAPPGMTVRNGRVFAPAPPEEHSLVIIGRNLDTFVFHDPDATVSKTPEPGFGLLHFDPSRGTLHTAASPAGLPVDSNGKSIVGDKRYQVISISTF